MPSSTNSTVRQNPCNSAVPNNGLTPVANTGTSGGRVGNAHEPNIYEAKVLNHVYDRFQQIIINLPDVLPKSNYLVEIPVRRSIHVAELPCSIDRDR